MDNLAHGDEHWWWPGALSGALEGWREGMCTCRDAVANNTDRYWVKRCLSIAEECCCFCWSTRGCGRVRCSICQRPCTHCARDGQCTS